MKTQRENHEVKEQKIHRGTEIRISENLPPGTMQTRLSCMFICMTFWKK